MDSRKKGFIVNALRRASYRWPSRYMALKQAHVGKNAYFCAHCPEGVIHPKKGIQMDHKIPLVDPEKGWEGFNNDYMDRMFPDTIDGWQVLCKEHHDIKTEKENIIRKKTKEKKKRT